MPAPIVAGVCSGLSVHLGVPVRTVRLAIIVLSLFFGAGALLYLWLLATVPLDDLGQDGAAGTPVTRLRSPLARIGRDTRSQAVSGQLMVAGGILLIVAVGLVLAVRFLNVRVNDIAALAAVGGGIALVWTQVPNLENWKSPRVWIGAGSGILLVLLGVIVFLSRSGVYNTFAYGAIIGLLFVLAMVVVLGPVWLGMMSRMADARGREARETERADIAAHLHDSVLQTLTLMRAAADDPVRVRALALAQERELRSWLYTGREDPGQSVAQVLRQRIETAETTYGVEVSVVTVGDAIPGPAELAAVAAAGEATANALRHGLPPVSVYLEVFPQALEIFVKDSGPGFDPEQIPGDRHGVRDSILGRIDRVGGEASIRSKESGTSGAPGVSGVSGTEVRIRVPRSDFGEDSERQRP